MGFCSFDVVPQFYMALLSGEEKGGFVEVLRKPVEIRKPHDLGLSSGLLNHRVFWSSTQIFLRFTCRFTESTSKLTLNLLYSALFLSF